MTIIILAITVAALVVFALLYRFAPWSLWCGAMLNAAALLAATVYLLFAVDNLDNPIVFITFLLLVLIVLGLALFGVYALVFGLVANAYIVAKRERRTLANSLTLILAVAIVVLHITALTLGENEMRQPVVAGIWSGTAFIGAFILLNVLAYGTTLILACYRRRPTSTDYVIVLGAGLIDGRVPPLLAGRIDQGLRYARQVAGLTGHAPKLVMSGGQGPDEPQPEAQAMRDYALESGAEPSLVLTETRSRNTEQNLRYSKELMDADAGGEPYRCVFVTNGYHVLRAAIYARRAGLRHAAGIGTRTAAYFRPNAVIREYLGWLALHKHLLLAVAIAGVIFGVGSGVLEAFFVI